jgi:hypothetical protein
MAPNLHALLALTFASAIASVTGCRRTTLEDAAESAHPPPVALTKCNAGILKAVEFSTLQEVLKTYYTECADLYPQPPCGEAWRKAATLATPTEQLALVSAECRKAYCPDLSGRTLALCKPDFEPTAAAIEAGWGPFLSAVIEREGGEYAPHLYPSLLGFYARTKQLEAALSPPDPSASAAPSGAAPAPSGAVPGPTGSAAPSTGAAPSSAPVAPAASAAAPAPAVASPPKATAPAAKVAAPKP